jgi:hypothetical protein
MKRKIFLIFLSILAVFTGIWLSPVYSMASSETELLKTAISHLREDVNELEQKMQDVDTKVDTHIANDSVTNGADGKDGKDGANGRDGTDGKDGQDGVGISKIEKTATNGNVDTYTITLTNQSTYNFTVTNGKDGVDGVDGADGQDGADGKDGTDGTDGKDAVYQSVGEKESVSTMEVVSMTVASAALLGNIVMIILNLKKRNI